MSSHKKIAKLHAEIESMQKITQDTLGLVQIHTTMITSLHETSATLATRIDRIERQLPVTGNKDLMYQ
jgi:hypothetical protein